MSEIEFYFPHLEGWISYICEIELDLLDFKSEIFFSYKFEHGEFKYENT